MELRQLQYFVRIARLGGLRQAADELDMSPGTLSEQLKYLERELDVRLFDRSHRHLELSEASRTLLQRTERALLELKTAREEMRDFALLWRAADKIVYSRTLRAASSERTRIERDFEPAAIRRLKESSPRDITVGGAELAGEAANLALFLVDHVAAGFGVLRVGEPFARGEDAPADAVSRFDDGDLRADVHVQPD